MKPDENVVLSATNITKSYGNKSVLKGMNITAKRGDVIAIIGASGSGKSTFLRCLNHLETPDSGQITFQGNQIDIQDLARLGKRQKNEKINALRKNIGMVFQSFNLWSSKTLLENITEAPIHVHKMPKKECVERANELLDSVGLSQFRNYYPKQLSGGQQQRASIARALAIKPALLLFDEPTSALDPELVGEVLNVMQKLAQAGSTMLVVTHEMSFARNVSNKVIFCENGSIVDEGDPHEILSNAKLPSLKKFLANTLIN